MLGRLDVRDAPDQSYSGFSQLLSNPMSEMPLTYHGELMNGYSALATKRLKKGTDCFHKPKHVTVTQGKALAYTLIECLRYLQLQGQAFLA
jgi:hypothetical protein